MHGNIHTLKFQYTALETRKYEKWKTTETDKETYYPLANEVAKGYSNATVRPSVTSLWTL
jgi:hypothetical protein